ncbi:MAG TPA: hypothetical protein VMU93_01765 [Caulobacteraceae bacterium]|nr:hypothetical protein [Caulobacteraceae bacterium]
MTRTPFQELALIAVVGAIGVVAALRGEWTTAGLALTGCLGALNLSPKGPSGPQP